MPLEKLPQLLARLYLRKIQHLPDSFTLRSHGWSAVANAQSITHFPAANRNSDVLSDRSLHMSRLFPFLPVSEDSLKMYDDVNDKTFVLTRGLDACLTLYPLNEWNNVERQLGQLSTIKEKNRNFKKNKKEYSSWWRR